MIARGIRIALWLAAGSAILSGLSWLFLNTPETNTLTLGASLVLLIALLMTGAVVVNAAVLMARGGRLSASVRQGLRGTLWFIAVLIPLVGIWWALARGQQWVGDHSGEINAWFIARFGWADISRLLIAEQWIERWLSWVVVPLAAVSLLAALLERGARGGGERWLRRAWRGRTLAIATIVWALFFVLPWQLTTWRPNLPATWVQPAVAALRLLAVVLLWAVGAAVLLVISLTSPPAATPGAVPAADQP
jgi:hypothetical protein